MPRRPRRGTGLFLTLGIVIVLLPTPASAEEARPYIYGCGMTWGNWLLLSGENAREWDRRSMNKIVEMGGTNCPANFAWIDIEPTPGNFNWDYVDHQVAEANARGLEVFAYTGLTPDWALPPGVLSQYGSGIGYRFPPDEQYIPQFEDFFRTLAARYRGQVKYYEFWNEPNGCSWINDGCSNGHMAHTYVPWLQRWYTAMKQGDPDCVLAVGGLDYHTGVTHGYQYIEDIYTHGGGNYFDAVAIHPYNSGGGLHWQAITDTYQVLVNHGDGHKKLWLNEWGWHTSDENWKAANVSSVLNTLKTPQYHMVFQANYLIITDLPGTPDWGHDYGLCGRNLGSLTITPRQSWYAFRDADKTWPESVRFSASPRSGPAPLAVQFTDESTVTSPTGWFWEFGDGQTSNQQHPSHTYTGDGTYTVRLTVTGANGPEATEEPGFIVVDSTPPAPGLVNPSFEDNGGSLHGWEVVHINGEGPDNPPWNNNNPWNVTTQHGTHFGGKITNGLRMDFCLGQVVGVSDWHVFSPAANWQLSTLVQLRCTHENNPNPTGVHQVWEIGWNSDGSEPDGIMDCDHYQQIASFDANYTGNGLGFHPLEASGSITDVTGLRAVAIRVRLFNNSAWWWTFGNIDNLSLVVTTVRPDPVPADFDNDYDVDIDDYLIFETCATGPGVGPPAPGCEPADLDSDNDVDHVDFGLFQKCLGRPNVPADPGCAD